MVDGSIKYKESEGSIHKVAGKIMRELRVITDGLTGIVKLEIPLF